VTAREGRVLDHISPSSRILRLVDASSGSSGRFDTMASEATPRINAKYLESFMNQTVRILGKVVSLRGETATIDANGTINVLLNRVSATRWID